MAFSFSNAVSRAGGFGESPSSSGAPIARDGPDLQEIQTDKLGFAAINGAAQLRLIPTPWPSDALPPPSASLLAVASWRGLVAAAGPDGIYLASTQAVRAAFREKTASDTDNVRSFDAQMHVPYPRPGHIAFSADESILVGSSQDHGGLDAFQLINLGDGQPKLALQISTGGKGLRSLIPNPSPESPHLFALVTNDGHLLLADLQGGSLKEGKTVHSLKSGVTCCSWSNKGKQLIAGGADGTVTQMKPDGTVVAVMPKSTSIPEGYHVSGISWLENDSFFIIYTPNDTNDGIPPSEYYIVTRAPKSTDFTFRKLPEVVTPYGVERIPPFHFITRLRNFPPHIQDMLVLTSSCSTDVGVVTKADEALARDDEVVGDFTMTAIGDDSRRAQLPMGQDLSDTTPIGMALDLSSTEKVPNPIPADVEIIETPGPAPNILVLTNEGHLLSWWVIYNDSVRENTLFSGLEVITSPSPTSELSPPPVQSEPEPEKSLALASTFGQGASASTFSKPSLSAFGSANSQSTFGSSSESAFGKPSTIGKASWTSSGFGSSSVSQAGGSSFGQPSFGQPGFGSATSMGGNSSLAFGSASELGSRSGGFGQPAGAPSTSFGKPSAFGATSFGNSSSPSSHFGATAAETSGSSGFAAFSQGAGFGGAKKDDSSSSPFAKASGDNVFGTMSQESQFGTKASLIGSGTTGAGSSETTFGTAGGFKLESSFKRDETATDDLPQPKDTPNFGLSSLNDTLGEPHTVTSPTHDKEEEMEDERGGNSSEEGKEKERPFASSSPENQKHPPQSLVTPPSTLSQSKATPAQPVSSLFGSSNQESTTPLPLSTTAGSTFGQSPTATPKDPPAQQSSTTPNETPAPFQKTLFDTSSEPIEAAPAQKGEQSTLAFGNGAKPSSYNAKAAENSKIKQEASSDDDSTDLTEIPEAPLPPDPVSKPRYASADTSVSSLHSKITQSPDDISPPGDFQPANKSAAKPAEEHALASDGEEGVEEDDDEDDFSSDFEGSGEDVDEPVSPIEESTEERSDQVQTSPESFSKGGEKSPDTSPTADLFTKVSTKASQKPVKPLFGEIGSTGPILPPPQPQESPRSPSPVRNLRPIQVLRAEPSRSVSAPAHPRSVIDKRKAEHAQSQMAVQAARAREEEIAKQKAVKAEEARLKEQAEAEELQRLEDNEDERLRDELQAPVQAAAELDDLVTYQPKAPEQGSKSGIPAQIERLYQDINSMIYTLGINSRSLSAFMKYQQDRQPNQSWPSVLKWETPIDALNDELVLDDISRLHEGHNVLEALLNESEIQDVAGKLQECQNILTQDLLELRTKLASIRKTLNLRATSDSSLSAPLSAEQASVQHDLRKSSAVAQSRLVQVEESLSVLRAKLTELAPSEQGRRQSMFGAPEPRKKPTVEAVSNTIAKMTAMAEKKSADIDVLEAQLRKLEVRGSPVNGVAATPNQTPHKERGQLAATTPGSGKSVYHTPKSRSGGSIRSTPGMQFNSNGVAVMIPGEDRDKWQAKARRKKEMASILKEVLDERMKASSVKT